MVLVRGGACWQSRGRACESNLGLEPGGPGQDLFPFVGGRGAVRLSSESFFSDLEDSIFFPASIPTNLLAFKQSYTSDSHSSGKKEAGNIVSG